MKNVAYWWEQYKCSKDLLTRNKLIEHYVPLVKKIARRVYKGLQFKVEFDDLVSEGIFGLIKAVENFDLSRQIKFETYATQVIRGAMLNFLRDLDWVPERLRVKARKMEQLEAKFVSEYGKQATKEEIAELMQISVGEVYELIANLGCAYLLSLNQPLSGDLHSGEEGGEIIDLISDVNAVEPLQEVYFKEQREEIKRALSNLPERERILIEFHYFERMPLQKIAETLGVTKQRVSQIHGRALKLLRDKLGKQKEDRARDFLF